MKLYLNLSVEEIITHRSLGLTTPYLVYESKSWQKSKCSVKTLTVGLLSRHWILRILIC